MSTPAPTTVSHPPIGGATHINKVNPTRESAKINKRRVGSPPTTIPPDRADGRIRAIFRLSGVPGPAEKSPVAG
ncbi:MAG: hypothetical protein GHCLOJNM_01016 [bacterium]|nr:hypothetical protein [bacterium]